MTYFGHVEHGFFVLIDALLTLLKTMGALLCVMFCWPLYLLSKFTERYNEQPQETKST